MSAFLIATKTFSWQVPHLAHPPSLFAAQQRTIKASLPKSTPFPLPSAQQPQTIHLENNALHPHPPSVSGSASAPSSYPAQQRVPLPPSPRHSSPLPPEVQHQPS